MAHLLVPQFLGVSRSRGVAANRGNRHVDCHATAALLDGKGVCGWASCLGVARSAGNWSGGAAGNWDDRGMASCWLNGGDGVRIVTLEKNQIIKRSWCNISWHSVTTASCDTIRMNLSHTYFFIYSLLSAGAVSSSWSPLFMIPEAWMPDEAHVARVLSSFSPFSMVIDPPSESYSSFQAPIIPEDSAQSSEDGSGMHSPSQADHCSFTFFHHPALQKVHYPQDHLDIHATSGMITPQYDYGHNLSAQQPLILDTSLELPNSSVFRYSQSCTQTDFHNPSPVSSRIAAGVSSIDFRYSLPSSSERRFPGRIPSLRTRQNIHSLCLQTITTQASLRILNHLWLPHHHLLRPCGSR